MKRLILIGSIIGLVATAPCLAQESDSEPAAPAIPDKKLVPVFPNQNDGFIHIEGESAVSTNFDKEPTLLYSASNSQSIQLNRYTGLYGGAAFYAEYVFHVQQKGTYEFWYAGTPPGPKEDVYPSYASPFSYQLDDGPPIPVFREDINVVETYTPAYYWNRLDPIELDAGVHKLRVEVTQKRRYDGKYYFFLDSFFLLEQGTDPNALDLPAVFPRNMAARDIDRPFGSINDYEWLISQDPNSVTPYIELSMVYSLLGNYISALKYLNRASLVNPDDPLPLLLIAKNRLWKGDVSESLNTYSRLLEKDPDDRKAWAEAGKVAAWSGQYREAERIFSLGLEKYPGDLNLLVNQGLTYLWALRGSEGEAVLEAVTEQAMKSIDTTLELAEIYTANGYPDLSVEVYLEAIKQYPEHLQLYLLLAQAYWLVDKREEAEDVYDAIVETFLPSERLTGILESFTIELGLRQKVIDDYRAELVENPDNLALRELLVQTFFWNGLRREAINEYLNILANYAYRSLKDFDRAAADVMGIADSLAVLSEFYGTYPDTVLDLKNQLNRALGTYRSAAKKDQEYRDSLDAAKEKGDTASVEQSSETADALQQAENALAILVSSYGAYARKYTSLAKYVELTGEKVIDLREQEAQERDAFNEVVGSKGWQWNKTDWIEELEEVSARGLDLADYILVRLHQLQGDTDEAADRLVDMDSDVSDTAYIYARMQHEAQTGDIAAAFDLLDANIAALEEYTPSADEFYKLVVEAQAIEESTAAFLGNDVEAKIASTIEQLDQTRRGAAELRAAAANYQEVVAEILANRAVRMFYFHEEDTYLIRFELGDYYLADGDRDAAIKMFDYVLNVDPWNTSAVYKLGTVYQLDGEWFRAMRLYRQVYSADPLFENVAGLHNQLARQYADSLSYSGRIVVDTNRIFYEADGSFTTNIGSGFALDAGYSGGSERLYTAADDSSYQLHDFGIGLLIQPRVPGLTVKPVLGAQIAGAQLTSGGTFGSDVSDFLDKLYAEPRAGLDVSMSLGPLYTALTYRYGRVEETFAPDRERTLSHAADLNLSLPFSFLDIPALAISSMRTYGKFDYRSDSNYIYTVAQELVYGLHLADTPWSNLLFTANLIYESANDATAAAYYSPLDVLSLKGGMNAATWIGIGGGNVLGLSLSAGGGVYLEDASSKTLGEGLFQAEAALNLELTKADSVYWMNAAASATFTTFDPVVTTDYWSFSLVMGHRAKLPRLLAD